MKKIVFLGISVFLFSCSKKNSEIEKVENINSDIKVSEKNMEVKGDESLPGFKIIKKSDCRSCHKGNSKFIGPSYQEIANRYADTDKAMLAEKIMKGGTGNWGQVPMQPHENLTLSEAKEIVDYIISFKK